MRVLVVEDRAGMRTLVGEMLKALGYPNTKIAEDGAEAWEQLQAGDFDLLLTDRRMPELDGVELVRKLRQSPKLERLPVIMMSAFNEPHEVREAIEAGVDTYLAKPFTPAQLRDKLRELDTRRLESDVDLIVEGSGSSVEEGKGPLVVFVEAAATQEQLLEERFAAVRRFLDEGVNAIRRINAADSQIDIGYLLNADAGKVTRQLHRLQERIKMLVVSPSIGGGITLVRLASINNQNVTVILVCDDIEALPKEVHSGLQDLGVFVVERDELTGQSFERLLREFVVAKAYTPNRELAEGEDPLQKIEIDIKNMVSFPVLPDLTRRIQALDNDAESEIRNWGEAVGKDPSASAMVIRRTRSPIYGFNEEVTDVGRAVTLLGKKTVKELVLCQAVKQAFERVRDRGFDVEAFWHHSLSVATGAKILSLPLSKGKRSREQEREFAALNITTDAVELLQQLKLYDHLTLDQGDNPFIGGMMHDIGKVAMVVSYPGIFAEVVEEMRAGSWQLPMLAAEAKVAGAVVHTAVGRFLATAWGMDGALARAVSQHHNFAADDHMCSLVAIADFIAAAAHPFPQGSLNPVAQLASGEEGADLQAAAAEFLPGGLLEAVGLQVGQLVELAKVLTPTIRQSVQALRDSIRD
jgi:two-component system chemotaxis response regulator CheY